jgi:hypothetical protein
MGSDLANEEAKIPTYYSVTNNTALRTVCCEPMHCLPVKRHIFSHSCVKMCTILVYIHDLRNKMEPVKSSALTPYHMSTLTSGKGIADQTFAGDFTNLANILSGFFHSTMC